MAPAMSSLYTSYCSCCCWCSLLLLQLITIRRGYFPARSPHLESTSRRSVIPLCSHLRTRKVLCGMVVDEGEGAPPTASLGTGPAQPRHAL